jgi:hypothetical protein
MALALSLSCSMQHIAASLVVMAAWTAEAGGSLVRGAPLSTTNGLAANVDTAGTLSEDTWVDTQITAQTSPLCKSLSECRWNSSIATYADILSGKRMLLSGEASLEADTSTPSAEATPESLQFSGMETAKQNAVKRLSLETEAVRLSVLLGQSCTEYGPRQCWRSAVPKSHQHDSATPKQLRPITITFGESTGARTAQELLPTQSPLIKSLGQFRFSNA